MSASIGIASSASRCGWIVEKAEDRIEQIEEFARRKVQDVVVIELLDQALEFEHGHDLRTIPCKGALLHPLLEPLPKVRIVCKVLQAKEDLADRLCRLAPIDKPLERHSWANTVVEDTFDCRINERQRLPPIEPCVLANVILDLSPHVPENQVVWFNWQIRLALDTILVELPLHLCAEKFLERSIERRMIEHLHQMHASLARRQEHLGKAKFCAFDFCFEHTPHT